ncbi:putative integrase [Saccharolobus islandicus]|uniref:ORF D-335-like domain-containing protein n=2 Tax=Saccharolobus islandicus TaxID=43080 RepID=M9U9I7_SACIS|nr:putative integrase [Sulfolobus islandicus]ADX85392.1 integrase [Sulfolobus islandicus REY15A]AGJ62763.1 Hypothetical Protein SiL_1315 [Sulfolobus islandicus LAL14/1]
MPNFYVGSKFYVKEIKGKYYVYSIENGDDGKQRHTYIGSLENIVNFYINNLGNNIGGLRGCPPNQAFRACDPGSNPGRGTNF